MFDFEELNKQQMVGRPLKELLDADDDHILLLGRGDDQPLTLHNYLIMVEKYKSGDKIYYHVVTTTVEGFIDTPLNFITDEAKEIHSYLTDLLYGIFKKYKILYSKAKWFQAKRV